MPVDPVPIAKFISRCAVCLAVSEVTFADGLLCLAGEAGLTALQRQFERAKRILELQVETISR